MINSNEIMKDFHHGLLGKWHIKKTEKIRPELGQPIRQDRRLPKETELERPLLLNGEKYVYLHTTHTVDNLQRAEKIDFA